MKGLFVTGTDTGVGKTHVSAALIRLMTGAGMSVCPRKPVEAGCEVLDGRRLPADAQRLRQAAGNTSPLERVCPFPLLAPLSPDRAAALEGAHIEMDQVVAACAPQAGCDRLLVEGAGGFFSPLTADGLNADLAQRLQLPVLLVVADRLGCINHTLLTLEAIRHRALEVHAIVLNRPQPASAAAAMDNRADLERLTGLPVISHDYRGQDAQLAAAVTPL